MVVGKGAAFGTDHARARISWGILLQVSDVPL